MSTPHHLGAATAAIALVLVAVLSPSGAKVQAANVFDTLTQPGETGFVASHRGESEGAPENTIPAFELAIASGAEFVETDVQLTSDGVPVLMHDFTLDRTTDGQGAVWAHSWKELSELDAGSWYGEDFVGTGIPTLDDLLDLVRPSNKRVIIELKGSWTQVQAATVVDEVYEHGVEARVMIAGFDIRSLAAVAAIAPGLQRAIITHDVVGDPAILAATCGAIAIVTSQKFLGEQPDAVKRIHDAGLGVLAYTLNGEQSWSEAIDLGVDGIITDVPNELDEWLATSS